jgi:hypothetical protein
MKTEIISKIICDFLGFIGFNQDDIKALSAPRSPKWRRLRNEHLKQHPECAVCGRTKNIVPHHIVPVHKDLTKELDPCNLITLCEGETFNCHLFFGHLGNWTKNNPTVVEDAIAWRNKLL